MLGERNKIAVVYGWPRPEETIPSDYDFGDALWHKLAAATAHGVAEKFRTVSPRIMATFGRTR